MNYEGNLPPLSLYIHVPWCVRKCPYCDFNSHGIGHDAVPEDAYISALIQDLEQDLAHVAVRPLTSIFIGGGTPSLLSESAYQRLLPAIEERLPFAEDIEITLEANPGTFEQKRFEGFRKAGINRLSLGIQSFNDRHLEVLGRIHSGADAIRAITSARSAGFDNINLDLMHGLPDQQQEEALADIQQALDLSPEHISWYQLTLEPNTTFYSRPPVLPHEDILYDIQEAGHQLLESAGFGRYEISAYAHHKTRRARHNLNYWRFGDYLGIGAGAHGKLSHRDAQGQLTVERRWKSRQPESYLQRMSDPRGFLAGKKAIEPTEIGLEFLLNTLRLVEGVPAELWPVNTGLSMKKYLNQTSLAHQRGLLVDTPDRIQASEKGLLFLNDLLALCENNTL